MSISLKGTSHEETLSGPAARTRALEKDLAAAKRGDWEAKHRVERALMPLLTNMAKKRASDNAAINALIEQGKAGIAIAIKKFKSGTSGDRFQIFALPFIEGRMDKQKRPGFFARLFGG
jgi:DNA-directed RNA polymerase specialized sigma subunit